MNKEKLKFLNSNQVREIAQKFQTPVFVYSEKEIENRCNVAKNFPNAFGITVRYAMKANPNAKILQIMHKNGIHIDASSIYEVERALLVGFSAHQILLTSQQPPKPEKLKEIVEKGVQFNACSLYQLELFGKIFPNQEISIRINPGLGSGHTKKTDVGGTNSSFGIWHEYIDKVKELLSKYNLSVIRVHTHIGSGSDPEVWKAVAKHTLEYAEIFPTAQIVNLGGGYKVGRMSDEKTTDFQVIGEPVKKLFQEFEQKYNRKLHLEIEPGTHMLANCGVLISEIVDIVDTGQKGYTFIKLDTGMDANTRPSLYGARHPLIVVPKNRESNGVEKEYVVVGHCCESGDLFTQKMGGDLETRVLDFAEIGDYMVMEGVGAYCAGMSTKNYNSFPETPEILITKEGELKEIRRRQTLAQIIENEIFD
jgi:diaminopimelate decarboxylase